MKRTYLIVLWVLLVPTLRFSKDTGTATPVTFDIPLTGTVVELAPQRRIEELLEAGEYLPDEVLVRFVPGTSQGNIDEVLGKVDTGEAKHLCRNMDADYGRLYRLRLDGNLAVRDALKVLLLQRCVRYAEPNRIAYPAFEPNDPCYQDGSLWGHKKIEVASAWDVAQGEGVIVAVIDSGIDLKHPDMVGNVWTNPKEKPGNNRDDDGNGFVDDFHGWDFAAGHNDVQDTHFHGTLCASIIAAIGNNGQGTIGVAFKAKVMVVQWNNGTAGNMAAMAEAINYAAANGAHVINVSANGGHLQALQDAVRKAYEKGCVIVAATGNQGSKSPSLKYPAAYPGVIAVGAVKRNGEKMQVSNYGDYVDVVAPGNVITALRPGGGITTQSGTSVATPYVSGLAALILSANRKYSPDKVSELILSTAVDLGSAGKDAMYGWGCINAAAALKKVEPSGPDVPEQKEDKVKKDKLVGRDKETYPRCDQGETLMDRAVELERQGKYAEAIDCYKQVERLGECSKHAAAAKEKVKTLLADEKNATEYEKHRQKKEAQKLLDRARNYLANKMFDKAKELCEEVIGKYPSSYKEAKGILREIEESGHGE